MVFSFDIYTYADHHHEQLPHQLPSHCQTHWVAAMFAKLVGVEEDNTGFLGSIYQGPVVLFQTKLRLASMFMKENGVGIRRLVLRKDQKDIREE